MARPFYCKINTIDGLKRLRFIGRVGKMSDVDISKRTGKKEYEGSKKSYYTAFDLYGGSTQNRM